MTEWPLTSLYLSDDRYLRGFAEQMSGLVSNGWPDTDATRGRERYPGRGSPLVDLVMRIPSERSTTRWPLTELLDGPHRGWSCAMAQQISDGWPHGASDMRPKPHSPLADRVMALAFKRAVR